MDFLTLALTALLATQPSIAIENPGGCDLALVLQMREVVRIGRFNQFRGLTDYQRMLGPDFLADLTRLGRRDTWIDMGAGHARALKEYLLQKTGIAHGLFKGQAKLVAVTFRPPTDSSPFAVELDRKVGGRAARIRTLTNGFVEDIPDEKLGKADLITDIYGPVAYSDRLDEVVSKYLNALSEGGVLYIYDYGFLTNIKTATGDLTFAQWLKSIRGLHVEELGHEGGGLRVTKTTPGPIDVPKLKLKLASTELNPVREFVEVH